MDSKKKIVGNRPMGIVVAGMGGGSGKSIVAVGLSAALSARGIKVIPFKKGPDYIDSAWLQLAAGNPCYNLDPFLMTIDALKRSFYGHARAAEMVVIEGNRGLYDGVDLQGTYSTAELSVSLGLPVLLVVDCTKTTRTVAAMVLGCRELDSRVDIRGVVLNRIGTVRHENIVRQAVEQYTAIPVVGAFPRSAKDVFPQRHLGITPSVEHDGARDAVAILAQRAEKYLDLDRFQEIMAEIAIPEEIGRSTTPVAVSSDTSALRIGVIRDAAFQFYYPENLEALESLGVKVIEINALQEQELPEIDGLYIGGGFPETSVKYLADNASFRKSLQERIEQGLPVYAECGGLIYLGKSLVFEGKQFPLVGIFPVKFGLEKKPQAHGYTVLQVDGDNPFYQQGIEIKGHEFRYSKILEWQRDPENLALHVKRGVGFSQGRDGLVYKNVLALYTHVHAVATPQWAEGLMQKARSYHKECK